MRLRKLLGIMIAVLAIAGCCVFVYYQINPDSAGQIKIVKNTEMKEKHTPKVPSPVDSISYLDESDKSLEDRKSTRLNSSHWNKSRMPSSA